MPMDNLTEREKEIIQAYNHVIASIVENAKLGLQAQNQLFAFLGSLNFDSQETSDSLSLFQRQLMTEAFALALRVAREDHS